MTKGLWATASAYVLWGLLTLYWKLIHGLDATVILAYRVVLAAVFCLILQAFRGGFPALFVALKDRKSLITCMIAGVVVTINWGLYIWAVNDGRVLETSLGYYINPLMLLIVSAALFHERLSAVEWVVLALACVGVLVAVIGFGGVPWVSIAIPATFTLYGILKKRAGFDGVTALTIETLTVTPFALMYIIYMEFSGFGAFASLDTRGLIALSCAGVATGLPLILFGYGVKHVPLATVGFLQYITPTMTLIMGVIIFGERFTQGAAVTFIFICAALIIYISDKVVRSIHAPSVKL